MTGLKIGLILYGGLDGLSGGYLYDRKIVEGLREAGTSVDVVSLPLRHYGLALSDNFSPVFFRSLRQRRWDALLEDELSHPSLLRFNSLLRRKLSYPILSIVHHLRCCEHRNRWAKRVYRAVERIYLKTVDGFIFNSATTGAAVRHVLGQERPFVIALPGRDHMQKRTTAERIVERCSAPGPLRMLFLGNIIPRKGLHVLIRALSLLPRDGWRLTVAGDPGVDPGYTERILGQISESGLKESIRLAGRVGQGEAEDLLEDCHCLVMPSFYEGFGIAYLEAMAFGKPVVASSSGGTSEWIEDGAEGFLVPPGVAEILAERIMLFNDKDRLLKMSLAAFRKYSGHPTWSDSARKVQNFLARLAPSR